MKKIYSTIAILAISSLVFLSSCSKDGEDPITPVSPEATVSLNQNTNTTGSTNLYVKRDKLSAVIQVNGVSLTTTDLKRIYIYKKSTTISGGVPTSGAYVNYDGGGFSKDNNNNYYYDIPAAQKNNASLTLTVTLAANNIAAVSDEYYFAFTDASAFGGPTNTTGTLLGPAKIYIIYGVLTETTGHKINNFQGPNSGAFDLVTLTNKAATDPAAGKDIVDSDATTATWDKAFTSASGTLFSKIPSNFDYTNATDITIKAAYDAANNAVDTQTGVAAGDMFVANVRGSNNNYMLIKVTFISTETGSTGPGNNGEYMEFSVKKN